MTLGFSNKQLGIVSDVALVFRESRHMFKLMQKLLKTPGSSQLLGFLKRLRKQLRSTGVGESHLLPLLVSSQCMLLVFERVTERDYRLGVINTNPEVGLKFHAVKYDPKTAPKIKYRVCMVLDNIPKKAALDDIFWMALYQLVISKNENDMHKFYDILLPFLTGKPLENSLVEAEAAAKKGTAGAFGSWRSPQRTMTAYARCAMAALDYMLQHRGLSTKQSKQVRVGIRAQFVAMIRNDLDWVFPDANGEKVCRLACQQLSYATVKLAESAKKGSGESTGESKVESSDDADVNAALKATSTLVGDIDKMLSACSADQV